MAVKRKDQLQKFSRPNLSKRSGLLISLIILGLLVTSWGFFLGLVLLVISGIQQIYHFLRGILN